MIPVIVDNFLSQEEIALCRHYVDTATFPTPADRQVWQERHINCQTVNDILVRKILRDKQAETLLKLKDTYSVPDLYPQSINFTRWISGNFLLPHADKENPGGVPHPWYWRDYTGLIYINDDYTGGEIYFPNVDLSLKPKAGTLVIFPGTLDYLHGVKIVGGLRHTLTMFFTLDITRKCREL
jgi:hypothetical protein